MSTVTTTQALVNSYAQWNYPTSMRVGAGRVDELVVLCRELSVKSPLLITDPGLVALPMIGQAVRNCQQAGLRCAVFSDIKGNPNGDNVEQGVNAYHHGKHDGVIGFGGGSALDVAKAVAFMVGQTRPLWDFEDVGDNWRRANEAGIAALIAVPTTAGTGSEVGRAAVITDEVKQCKKIIFHPRMLPQIVILDPQLTVGLPAAITAATGMDALSHNLEAYCAPSFHPMAEGIALEGVRLVKQFLPRAYADGTDLLARMQMLVASSMGATAFQRGLGAMHALAHPLGALFDTHHGLLNAILMPYVLTANREAIDERIARLAKYLELNTANFDGFLGWILALRKQLAIPHSLVDAGISKAQVDNALIERIGELAAADPSASGNPLSFSARQYADIFCRALDGAL